MADCTRLDTSLQARLCSVNMLEAADMLIGVGSPRALAAARCMPSL
jgi:hypothetical protein